MSNREPPDSLVEPEQLAFLENVAALLTTNPFSPAWVERVEACLGDRYRPRPAGVVLAERGARGEPPAHRRAAHGPAASRAQTGSARASRRRGGSVRSTRARPSS